VLNLFNVLYIRGTKINHVTSTSDNYKHASLFFLARCRTVQFPRFVLVSHSFRCLDIVHPLTISRSLTKSTAISAISVAEPFQQNVAEIKLTLQCPTVNQPLLSSKRPSIFTDCLLFTTQRIHQHLTLTQARLQNSYLDLLHKPSQISVSLNI